MLVVETIAKIRRGYFVQGKAIKAISRELKVSRKVVRKVIRSGETAFVYERTVQPQPKLGPWREELERLLAANAARSNRERLTLVRLFEELRGLGYCGGYDAGAALRGPMAASAERADFGICAADLRARRGLPVRLETASARARTTMQENGGSCIVGAVARRLT